jgi:predicted PurR-regulated permease PerM
MSIDNADLRTLLSKDLTDVLIRIGLIAFLVVMSVRVFTPFMGLLLWALILAVTLYPLHQRVAGRLGDRQGRAATLIVLAGILLIGAPVAILATSFADYVHDVHTAFENNTLSVPAPKVSVAQWPLVGEELYNAWNAAYTDLPAFLETLQPQLGNFSKAVLSFVAGTAGGIFSFLFSLIIAGIMMAYGQSGSRAILKIGKRLAGPAQGGRLQQLSAQTIRSVSLGVIGVAFIQALLLGVGFVWADVPGAGLLAFVVLILGIAQLPAAVVSLPVIAYVWWAGDSTMGNVLFTGYFLVAGMADNFLKPLLLGRGVDAPMPVILLGALGGMVSGGMIGLFIGAVFLTLGYVIFMDWVAEMDTEEAEPPGEDSA